MNGACLFLGILFLAAGIYFYSGKAVNHITAWKTMPEEEKRKIHIRPLCRNVGMMIATSGIIFLLSGAWYAFRKSGFLSIYRNFVLPGSRIYFYRYCCTDPSACTGGCGSAYHHYNFDDGIYFRYTSVCPGIPVGECRGEAVGDDYHHLHGYKKEQREAGDPSGRFGSR